MKTQEQLLSSYVKRGHKRVQGWLHKPVPLLVIEIDKIQNVLGIKGNVAEIGVHHGKFFIVLKLLCKKDELALAIDVFDNFELNVDISGRGDKDLLIRNLNRFSNGTDNVRIIQKDSMKLTPEELLDIVGGTFRIFSVDGGHTAEITHKDLLTASQVLSDGGVIILDDYFNEPWPGVSEGLNRFLSGDNSSNIFPFLIGANKVFMTKGKENVEKYLREFEKLDIKTKKKYSEFYNGNVLSYSFDKINLRNRGERSLFWKKIRGTKMGKAIKNFYNFIR